jgi:cytochrome b
VICRGLGMLHQENLVIAMINGRKRSAQASDVD